MTSDIDRMLAFRRDVEALVKKWKADANVLAECGDRLPDEDSDKASYHGEAAGLRACARELEALP